MNDSRQYWRMFIAIESPPAIKAALKRAQQSLRRLVGESGVRWTSEEQFHLTLTFLGNVPAASVELLSSSLAETCLGFGALCLRAEGIGFFPSSRRPRVVWAAVTEKDGRLRELHRMLVEATATFSNEEPENDFHAHITLGRVKHLARPDEASLATKAMQFAETVFGEWKVDKVQLIRSQLSSSGSVYTTIAEPPLL